MRNQVFKKLFSVLLALIMVAGLLPASAMAGGWGAMDVDTTPELTETEQPTESAEPTAPTETETSEVTEVPEPTPENPAATVEPTQGEPTDEGIMPANVMPVQANVAARDISKDGFIRIFHLDCGRKHFSVSEINGIIDQLAENNYTHIQLAFGNDGLRFLLNDMSVTVNGKTYDSDSVKTAIKIGNSQLTNGSSGELSQSEMESIISHANDKGIKVIPLFNAPGHMFTVVKAMNSLGVNGKYIRVAEPTDARTSNWAVDPTDADAVAFAEALLGKYAAYFESKGSTMFNIGADESGINDQNYAAYAAMVNAMNSIVKNAGMTTLAYNDGIYNTSFASSQSNVAFDNDIVICYWTSGANSESVENLLQKGFKILNNSDNWYYVLGDYLYQAWWPNGQWGYNDALNGIENTPVTMMKGYNGSEKPIGSILCVWCDAPNQTYEPEKVYDLIKTMANANPDYFKKEAANVPAVEISENETNVKTTKETVDGKTVYKAAVKADGSSKIQLKVVNIDNTVNWASDKNKIATVDGNGLVTFKGAAGIVTITATPVAATRSINETAAYSITFNVTREGEVPQIEKDITVVEGGMATDVIEGYNYSSADQKDGPDEGIATVVSVAGTDAASKRELGNQQKPNEGSTNAQYEGVFSDGTNYLIMTAEGVSNTTDVNNATVFTVKIIGSNNSDKKISISTEINGSTYYLSYSNATNGTFSVTTTAPTTSANYWQCGSENDFFTSAGWSNGVKRYLSCNNGDWTPAGTSGTAKLYEINETGTKKQTIVTFKGVAEGTTYVTIGHVKYKITVTKENVTNAPKLPVQLWITNVPINVTNVTQPTTGTFNRHNNDVSAQYVAIDAKAAYGSNGVLLADLVPKAIGQNNAALESGADDRNAKYVFWKGTVLNNTSSGTQTLTEGIQEVWTYDRTLAKNRIDYTYVRYLNSTWEVSSDRESWQPVTGEGSTGSYSTCKQQIIAYYMQRTDVTNEIITDVVDWGNTTEKWDTEKPKQYVVLDFAVQYPTERIPATFPVEGKSVYYHCNEGDIYGAVEKNNNNYYRRIGLIKGINTDNYEVYMITVTPTSDTPTDQLTNANTGLTTNVNLQYNGTEKVVWVDDEANLPAEFTYADAKYKSISGKFEYKVGGEPNVPGLEIYQRQGMLVTYYLRAKVVEDSLHVYYVDRSANDYVFYNYTISVANGTVFKEGIGLNDPWKGNLKDGDVANIVGVTEWVTADLSAIPQIGAQYRYSNYECKEVARKDKGKSVYLYYEFSAKITFVVDFGLPLVITPQRVNAELANATISKVLVDKTSQYADIKVNDTDKSITYTLNRMINGKDNISITYEGVNSKTGNSSGVTYTVTIIPATNVYYEDSFAKFYGSDGTQQTVFNPTSAGDVAGTWYVAKDTSADNNANAKQALETLGQADHNPYGYDPAYQNSTMFSMGSARKVTVTQDMAKDGVVWPTAQFTFKGTGFDIISLTDNTSGAIFVFVYKGTDTSATGTRERSHIVDNYYGYTQDENGNWVVNNNANNALYQIPVMRIRDLEYGEYTAVVKVFYDEGFNHTTKSEYSFWLDAVRVYDPMGKSETTGDTYGQDGEAYPQYIKLRSELKKLNSDGTASSGALFIDGKENANISEYSNYGPNNEVYLAKGQAITFKLTGNLDKIAAVQIGAKSPNSSAEKTATMKVGTDVKQEILGTATEMYYDISAVKDGRIVTITNTGEAILSLTNLKITYTEGKQTVSLGEVRAEQQTQAVQMVRALFAPAPVEPEPEPEPEKTFEPERFEASWSRNVMQGRKATLTVKTSEDVEAITVDGQTIRSYRTRTERVGFGRRAKRITYREFTYSMVAQESADFSVTAINAEGTESEAITARLTVKTRPNSMRDMWDWFKGWF